MWLTIFALYIILCRKKQKSDKKIRFRPIIPKFFSSHAIKEGDGEHTVILTDEQFKEYNITILGCSFIAPELEEVFAFLTAVITAAEVLISTIEMFCYLVDILDAFIDGTEEDLAWALDGFEDTLISASVGIFGLSNTSKSKIIWDRIGDGILGSMDYVQRFHNKMDALALSKHGMNLEISKVLMENREAIIERIMNYGE